MAETKKPSKRGGKTPEYIEHEPVAAATAEAKPAETVEAEAEEISPEKQAKLEVAKLNLADTAIAELKAQYGGLTIAGPEDKAGYKAVKAAWQEVRSVRTGLEKRALAIRNKFSMITKLISKEQDRLIDQLTPLEEELQGKYKAIDDAKELAQKQKEEAEQQQLMARLEELVGLGMKLVDGFYRLGETISMDIATLRALPEEQYLKLKQTVEAKKAELDKLQKEQQEQQEREQQQLKDQQDKLKKQQEDLQKEKDQMMAERREVRLGKLEGLGFQLSTAGGVENLFFRKLAVNLNKVLEMPAAEFSEFLEATTLQVKDIRNEEAKAELKAQVSAERAKKLLEMGFVLKGNDYVYDNGHQTVHFQAAVIDSTDDENFALALQETADYVKQADEAKLKHQQGQAEEKRLLEIKEKFIAKTMDIAGLGYDYAGKYFFFKNEKGGVAIPWTDLLPLSDEDIVLKAKEIGNQVLDLKKKSEDDKKAKELEEKQQREAALDDKGRFNELYLQLLGTSQNIHPTAFKSKIYQKKAKDLRDALNPLIEKFKP